MATKLSLLFFCFLNLKRLCAILVIVHRGINVPFSPLRAAWDMTNKASKGGLDARGGGLGLYTGGRQCWVGVSRHECNK